MKRWVLLFPGIALALALGVYFGWKEHKSPDLPANIVLVSIDTLRADHVGCYGHHRNTTPNLDRIAEEGVRFENVVSTTSWTIPAHAGMFTSQYDLVHGVLSHTDRLDDNRTTMAETMKKAGYKTAGFYSSITMDPVFGFGQGFDEYISCYSYSSYVDPFRNGSPNENFTSLRARIQQAVPDKDFNLQELSWQDVTGPTVHRKVAAWLDDHHDERFFLFVHYWDPHYDYVPPSPYDTMFDPHYEGDINGKDFISNPNIKPDMDPRDLEHVMALYDGEIRFTDHYVGLLVEKLESLGILDESLLIITSDHGEEFFEHGSKGHRNNLYDESIMVPLIMRYPEQLPAGKTIARQARIIDIFPTAAALMEVPGSPEAMGENLAPYMKGQAQMPELSGLSQLELENNSLFSLRTLQWKFLYHRQAESAICFDLEEDPAEKEAVPWKTPLFKTAKERFKKKIDNVNAFSRNLHRSEEKSRSNLTKEQEQRLRDLGYLK